MLVNNNIAKTFLPNDIRGEYRFNAKIINWFAIDSIAEVLFKPLDFADLQYFLQNIPQEVRINILGSASNVIIKEPILNGVLIRLGKNFDVITVEDLVQNNADEVMVTIGAGALCNNASLYLANNGISGLEFFSGIPGNVGGAIFMNAGCYEGEVSHSLISITATDYQGNLQVFTKEQCGFSYRLNKLMQEKKLIILEAKFLLKKGKSTEILEKIKQLQQKRQDSQPIRAKTGGSTFKNPINSHKKAWQLIDESGCRGLSYNDAKISEKHCNFLINQNNSSAADILTLIETVQLKVFAKTKIMLELEIKIISN